MGLGTTPTCLPINRMSSIPISLHVASSLDHSPPPPNCVAWERGYTVCRLYRRDVKYTERFTEMTPNGKLLAHWYMLKERSVIWAVMNSPLQEIPCMWKPDQGYCQWLLACLLLPCGRTSNSSSSVSFPGPHFIWLHEGKAALHVPSCNRIKQGPGNEATCMSNHR